MIFVLLVVAERLVRHAVVVDGHSTGTSQVSRREQSYSNFLLPHLALRFGASLGVELHVHEVTSHDIHDREEGHHRVPGTGCSGYWH